MLPCSSITAWLLACWCKPSTFWVIRVSWGTRRCISARAKWPGLGFTWARRFASRCVPLPHQARVAAEGLGGSQIFGAVLRPQAALCFAEGGHAALRGNTRSGQHGNVAGLAQRSEQSGGELHGSALGGRPVLAPIAGDAVGRHIGGVGQSMRSAAFGADAAALQALPLKVGELPAQLPRGMARRA